MLVGKSADLLPTNDFQSGPGRAKRAFALCGVFYVLVGLKGGSVEVRAEFGW